MTNKLIISKPGFNALTETDPNNLVFSSDYNTFKYFASGSTSVHVNASGSPFTVEYTILNHALGYIPVFTAFIKEVGLEQYYSLPFTFADFGGYVNIYIYATSADLILRVEMSSTSAFDFDVWYKVFKNKII